MRQMISTLAALAVLAVPATAQDLDMPLLPPTEIKFQGTYVFDGLTKDQWEQIESDGYFTAIAVSPTGAWGASTGNNSLEIAEKDALTLCSKHVEGSGNLCSIYSIYVPQGYQRGQESVLGFRNRRSYQDYLTRDTVRAFAANSGRFVGFSYGYGSRADAEARALQECEGGRQKEPDGDVIGGPCRIISVTQ